MKRQERLDAGEVPDRHEFGPGRYDDDEQEDTSGG